MRKQFLTLAAFCGLSVVLAGCPKDPAPADSGSGGVVGEVVITANPTARVANGTNQITLTVTNTTGSAVNLTADRGTLSPTSVAGASGTVIWTTCDASIDSVGCPGTAKVTGSNSVATGSVQVTFVALLTACSTSCTADPGCAGLPCTGTSGGTCSVTTPSICQAPADPGTEPLSSGVTVTPARTRVPPSSVTDVVVTVASGGSPVAGAAVTLSTSSGTLSATTGTTGGDGKVTVKLTMGATPATATVTASTTVAPVVTGTGTVTVPALGALQLTESSAAQRVLGVKGSAWNELGVLQIRALDTEGNPYPDGLPIRFEHKQLGGSSFTGTLTADTATCLAAQRCVGFQAATASDADKPDTMGLAAAWLQSGTIAGTLPVTATATVGGVTRTVSLPTISVVGAKASGANFSIVCGPRNVPALAETDCAVSMVDAPFTCAALLEDRYGNLLGTSTHVIFASEAAGVGQVVSTPAYDPSASGATQADLGSAVQIFETLGRGLPFDVAPQAGEPMSVHGDDGCGSRTHNPRDGVSTVIAMTAGEEAFFDANGNGAYDLGEPYVDLGEPFADADDDGQWDPGEWFLNVDGSVDDPATASVNEAYTKGNGKWDANTMLWTQTVVVYTGAPDQVPEYVMAGGPPAVPTLTANLLGTRWSDTLVPGCTGTPVDPGFAVLAKVTGPPEILATSESHFVYAADLNLNMLTSATNYTVALEVGSVGFKYFGLPRYADSLGFFYRDWVCDSTGANCASQCRATANLPCVMKPSLSAFSCGPVAEVVITGSDKADGLNALSFTPSTSYSVFGTSKTVIDPEWLTGSNL